MGGSVGTLVGYADGKCSIADDSRAPSARDRGPGRRVNLEETVDIVYPDPGWDPLVSLSSGLVLKGLKLLRRTYDVERVVAVQGADAPGPETNVYLALTEPYAVSKTDIRRDENLPVVED